MKNVLKGILHSTELVGIIVLAIATGSIPIFVVSMIPSLVVASKLVDDIHNNKIKDSIFSVYSNGKIVQNSLSHPLKMLSVMNDKDKGNRFIKEAISMFSQMDTRDKKGNLKTYKTKSQAKTLFLLKQLERNGYIQNLEYKPAGKMHLIVEKVEMGNAKGMNKKHQMYKIEFNLTDKERTKEDLINLIEKKDGKDKEVVNTNEVKPTVINENIDSESIIDNSLYTNEEINDVSNDLDTIIDNTESKEELLELKEQLSNINSKENKEEENKGRIM